MIGPIMESSALIFVLVMMSIISMMSLVVSVLIRPSTGLVLFSIASVSVFALVAIEQDHETRRKASFDAAEIGREGYASLNRRKGMNCRTDQMIAQALADGRITNAESRRIGSKISEIEFEEEKDRLRQVTNDRKCDIQEKTT